MGKEYEAIHDFSDKKTPPFIAEMDCYKESRQEK